MGKPLSLADRIRQAKNSNENTADREKEKNLITSFSAPSTVKSQNQTPEHVDNRTPEQLDNWTREHLPGQVSRHVDNRTPEQVSTQVDKWTPEQVDKWTTEQVDNRTSEHVDTLNTLQKPKDLRLNQYQILHEIYFNRPFKVKGPERIGESTNIPYGTVRNILKSLTKKGYISKPFSINDGVNKGTSCQVNELKCVSFFGASPIINSEQQDNRTPGQVDTWTSGQVSNRTSGHLDASYKKERKTYNKLSFYIENSEFWGKQGLTFKKCESWLDELNLEPDFLHDQLNFAEHTSKVIEAKTPVSYFYAAVKKDCFHRPSGFEFPEEKRIRIQQEENKRREDLIRQQEENRAKEKELTDREGFLIFLDDKDSVEASVKEIEKKFMSPGMKIAIKIYRTNGKIDSRLEGRLKQIFLSS